VIPTPAGVVRRRYQKGTLTDDGDRWIIRWRVDLPDPLTGNIKRVRKWDVLSKNSFPTKPLARQELKRQFAEANEKGANPIIRPTCCRSASV
jgi:hypothetical protein